MLVPISLNLVRACATRVYHYLREIDARDPAFFDLTGLFQVDFILIDKCEHVPADSNGIFMVQLLPGHFFFVNE